MNELLDLLETAQTIPMKKRGHFSKFSKKNREGKGKKKLPKYAKAYKVRRNALKKGLHKGQKQLFGNVGCSSLRW